MTAAAELVEEEAVGIGSSALLRVSQVLGQSGGRVLTDTMRARIEAYLVLLMEQSALNKVALCAGLRVVGNGPIFLDGSGIVGTFNPAAYFPAKLVFKGAVATFCGAP